MKKYFMAVAVLAAWASSGFGGIGVNWTVGGRVYRHDGEEDIAYSGDVVWQLIDAGENGRADGVFWDSVRCCGVLGDDDRVLATRVVPAGGGMAEDGTEWDVHLAKVGGDSVYEDLESSQTGGTKWVYQLMISQDVDGTWWYFQSDSFMSRTDYEGGLDFPDMFAAANGSQVVADQLLYAPEPEPEEEEEVVDGVTWKYFVSDGNATVTGGPTSGDLIIPSSLGGFPVTGIGERVFCDCSDLTSVAIPESVTDFGESAFSGCYGLTSVTIPQSICSSGLSSVFPDARISNVTIRDGVTSIGEEAFASCDALESVTIPESVSNIGYRAFDGCGHLKSVTLLGDITTIGQFAFSDCSDLTTVTISQAISKSKLSSIFAGAHTNIACVTVCEGVTRIGEGAFSGCTGLTSVTIPESVATIGHGAFSGCTGLTAITIPGSVADIKGYAFSGCSGLTSMTIPESVSNIEDGVFSGCTGLQSVTIPEGVTSIGESAFSGCSGLVSLIIPESVTSIGNGAFSGCTGLEMLFVPAWWKGSGRVANAGVPSECRVIYGRLQIVDGVEWEYATSNGQATVTGGPSSGIAAIPSVLGGCPVVAIALEAFLNASGLIQITIPDGVTDISSGAFSGCSGLTDVTIPNSVTNVGDSAFAGCSGLANVAVSGSVMAIGGEAFKGCVALTNLTISNNVTSIGADAFSDSGLRWLAVPAEWEGTGKLSAAGVPEGCTVLYRDFGLWIVEEARHFGMDGGGAGINTAGSGTWKATAGEGWITLKAATGEAGAPVVYMVGAATDAEPRTGYIFVSGYVYTVTQDGAGATISPEEATFEWEGGRGTISVAAPDGIAWQARANDGWLKMEKASGSGTETLGYTVEAFDEVDTRQGTLTVGECTFSVFQYGRRMKLGSTSSSQDYLAHEIPITVEALSITEWSVAPNASWISVVDAGNGKGSGSATIAIAENPSWKARTGTVDIGTESFTVTQTGRTELVFDIDPKTAEVGVEGADGNIEVTATPDLPWTAASGANWLTLTAETANGAGDGNVGYSALPNPTLYDRTGSITVWPEDTRVGTVTYTVTQPAAVAELSMDSHEFAAEGEWCDVEVSVSDIVQWHIQNNVSWLTVEGETRRVGPGTVTLLAVANGTVYPRSGTVTIARKTFHVTQAARKVEVGYTTKLFGADGGDAVVSVHADADVSWTTVVSDPAMITIFYGETGTGDGTITYIVSPYQGTGEARTGTITVGDKVIYITQRGYALSIKPKGALVPKNKGEGEFMVSASSGNAWTAIATEPWITLVEGHAAGTGDGTVRFLYADNDTGKARVGRIIVEGEMFTLRQQAEKMEAFPVVEDAGEVAAVLAGAGDSRLGEKIETVEEYESFQSWMDGKGLEQQEVRESDHAWVSYLLGAEALFKNEPTIVLGNGAENRVRGTRESGGSVFNVSVTIKDGEHVAAVDPEKVAALFKCTGDVEDWGGAELDASARKTGEEGNVLRFEVTPGDGTERRAFLRIGE